MAGDDERDSERPHLAALILAAFRRRLRELVKANLRRRP
jgi:hypothetical protein